MQKKIIILITVLVIGTIFFMVKNSNLSAENQSINNKNEKNPKSLSTSMEKISADKIEVIHFHGTQQCWSCITLGKYTLKAIKEKFPEEYDKGIIIFKDINGELPQNKDIVTKYQANRSSLFINAIAGGKDNIEEDVTVWRLVSNEEKFISHLEDKLKMLLGK